MRKPAADKVSSDVQVAFVKLLEFTTGITYPLGEVSVLINGEGMFEDGDDNSPFFTEGFLYNLLGKDDARTLLSRVRAVGEALGYSRKELP